MRRIFLDPQSPFRYKVPNSRSGRNASKTLSSARSKVMGNHHCGPIQPCKSCFILVDAIERWHYKVFPASPPDLQNLLGDYNEKVPLSDGCDWVEVFSPPKP